jgi:hypothetical protein
MTQLPTNYMLLPARFDGDEIIERLAIDHGYPNPGPESQRGDVAESLGLTLVNPMNLHGFSYGDV